MSITVISTISGEASFRSVYDDYFRSLILTGKAEPFSLNYHSYSTDGARASLEGGPWDDVAYESPLYDSPLGEFSLIAPETWLTWNSNTPSGRNDGAMWQGRGFNTRISGGFSFRNDVFSITIAPEYWAAQNRDFDIIPTSYSSGYGDYWTVFDNLQRYGDHFYDDFNWGQSEIRFTWKKYITAGFGNESIVIGPGQFNNILLSDNAGGFPHFDLGTPGFVDLGKWGKAEARGVWGYLHESPFFNTDSSDDWAWFSGSYLAYAPPFVPELSLGLNYQYYKPLGEWDGWDLVRSIPGLDHSNSATDNKDLMVSITFDWTFPQVGFEVYGEWARNDNIVTFEDLIHTPEHTKALMLGMKQVLYNKKDLSVLMSFEMTRMDQERTYYVRAAGPWYRHGWSGWTQGYTNNGQLLGAAIGPGSRSQTLALDSYFKNGSFCFSIQRTSMDEDYYYQNLSGNQDAYEKWVVIDLNFTGTYRFSSWSLFSGFSCSYSWDSMYILNNDIINSYFITGVSLEL